MELVLNLGWALVAAWMVYAWLRTSPRGTSHRRAQAVTLAVVILILLPAISMTDDLIAAQKPAEVVSSVRRDVDGTLPHSIASSAPALPQPTFEVPPIAVVLTAAPSHLSAPIVDHPALTTIQNRPPPAA
jgi:hypothetical protein